MLPHQPQHRRRVAVRAVAVQDHVVGGPDAAQAHEPLERLRALRSPRQQVPPAVLPVDEGRAGQVGTVVRRHVFVDLHQHQVGGAHPLGHPGRRHQPARGGCHARTGADGRGVQGHASRIHCTIMAGAMAGCPSPSRRWASASDCCWRWTCWCWSGLDLELVQHVDVVALGHAVPVAAHRHRSGQQPGVGPDDRDRCAVGQREVVVARHRRQGCGERDMRLLGARERGDDGHSGTPLPPLRTRI